MNRPIHVLGIAGSLRQGSYNRALLRAAVQEQPEGIEIETFDIAGIPEYNGDVHTAGFPEPAQRFIDRIAAADALLIATPEYNYSVPGVLKNAIDWASRANPSPFVGKPLAIMGASMGMLGSARAQYHLRQIAVFLDLHPINRPEIFVGAAHTKFDEEGYLTDDTTRQLVRSQLEALGVWTRRLNPEI